MKFDLWDVETNKYLGHFDDESDALVLVRTLVTNLGSAYADDLELGGISDDGEALASLSGAALIARADEVLSTRQNDQRQRGVVIGSKPASRSAKVRSQWWPRPPRVAGALATHEAGIARRPSMATTDSEVKTPEGILITSQGIAALKALDDIGTALKEQGLTLEDMIESGREIRRELLQEMYGIADNT